MGTPLAPGQRWALLSAVGLSRMRYATLGYAHLAKVFKQSYLVVLSH